MSETETGSVVVYLRVGLKGLESRLYYAKKGIRYEFDPPALFEVQRGDQREPKGHIPLHQQGVNARNLFEILNDRGLTLVDVHLAVPSSNVAPAPAPPSFLVGMFTDKPPQEVGLNPDHGRILEKILDADFEKFDVRIDNSDPATRFEWVSVSIMRYNLEGGSEPDFGEDGWTLSPKVSAVRTLANAMTA